MSDSKLKLRHGRKSAEYFSHAIHSKHTHTRARARAYVYVCVCAYIYIHLLSILYLASRGIFLQK